MDSNFPVQLTQALSNMDRVGRDVIIFCDPGVDDALMLIHVFSQNQIKVHAIIAGAGNVPQAIAVKNALAMCELTQQQHIKVFSGTAGGVNKALHVGDVIMLRKSYLIDAGDPNAVVPNWPLSTPNPVRLVKESVVYHGAKQLIGAAKNLKKSSQLMAYKHTGEKTASTFRLGDIATTDHFPNNTHDILRMLVLHIDAVDMESTSFMKVCWLYQKPCIAFRGVSNVINPFVTPSKYTAWNHSRQKAMLERQC